MELSIWLAKMIGVVYLILAFAILFNCRYYQKVYLDFFKESGLIFIVGLFTAVVGIAIVLAHNYWAASWEVMLTLFGWIALVKGALILLLPKQMYVLATSMLKGKGMVCFMGIIPLAIGLAFGYFGFLA